MKTAADNLLNEISQVLIAKLNTQKLDPAFLQKFFDELFKKILFVNKKIKIQSIQDTTDQYEEVADIWSNKIKKAFIDLTQDNDYETKYRQFLKRAFDPSKINSLIPSVSLNNSFISGLEKDSSNELTSTSFDKEPEIQIEKQIIETVKEKLVPSTNVNNKESNKFAQNEVLKDQKTVEQPQQTIIKELKTESVTTKDFTIGDNKDQNQPENKKQTTVNNVDTPTEIKEVNVVLQKDFEPTNSKSAKSSIEQPTIIKELKTESVIVNDLTTNSEIKQIQSEDKESDRLPSQSKVVNEIKSDGDVNKNISLNKLTPVYDFNEGRVTKIKETPKINLDGITSSGQNALTNVLEPLLKNAIEMFTTNQEKKNSTKSGKGKDEGGGLGFGATVAAFTAARLLTTAIGSMLKPLLSGIGSLFSRVGPMLTKFLGPVAAVAGGEIIGGQVGKLIGSNEAVSKFLYGSETAGKEAYEKYGTGMTGLARASYDLYKQGQDTKEQQKEHKRMSEERIAQSKESMSGKRKYNAEEEARRIKVVEDLKKQEEKLKKRYEEIKAQAWDGWNPFHDEQKETDTRTQLESIQELLTVQQNKLDQFRKLKNENSSEPKPPVPLKDGGLVTKPTFAMIAEEKPELVLPTNNIFNYNNQNKTFSTDTDGIVPLDEIFNQQEFSLNNTSLNDIAANTKDTNISLKALSEALFKLVTVFDKKLSQTGNTTIINGASKPNTTAPASIIASTNNDPIRRVRAQFA